MEDNNREYDKMKADLQQLAEDVMSLKETSKKWSAKTVQDLQGKAEEKFGEAQATARDMTQQADTYVKENTWASIGIAALVGLAIGALFSSKNRD